MEDSQSIETVAKAAKVELEAYKPKPKTLEDRIVDLEAQVKWLMSLGARARFKSKSKRGFPPMPEDRRVFEEICLGLHLQQQEVLIKRRSKQAVERRDAVMRELDKLSWSEYRIADIFGMTRSNVSCALRRIYLGKTK